MSVSHSCATVHNFSDFAQNLEICMRNYKKMHLNHFNRFFCMLYTSYVNFWEIYLNFCAQNSKLYFFTVQENQHLECMFLLSKTIVCLLLYNTIVILTHFHCLSALLFCHTV